MKTTLHDLTEIVVLDTEYREEPGERPSPVCFVAKEVRSGRIYRGWTNEEYPSSPPFATGPDVAVVCFMSSAEMKFCLSLGWPLPWRIIDLYVEHRRRTNGRSKKDEKPSLLKALEYYGLPGMSELEKQSCRNLILSKTSYSAEEQKLILDYCAADVDETHSLLRKLIRESDDLSSVFLHGEMMKVLADCEYYGVPIDTDTLARFKENWYELQDCTIRECNRTIPVYEGRTLKKQLIVDYLKSEGLYADWPKCKNTGWPKLDKNVLRDKVELYPFLKPLRDTIQMLVQLHEIQLTVGPDGRNRCFYPPVGTITGRVTPSSVKAIFYGPSFLRGLIKPVAGYGLAYIDIGQCEFGTAAALSNDPAMIRTYLSDDPYMSFAKIAGAVPEWATKETHERERRLFKQTLLSLQYQTTVYGLAKLLRVTIEQAQYLYDRHHEAFAVYWAWLRRVIAYGQLHKFITSRHGWPLRIGPRTNPRTIGNYPVQASASDLFRLACVLMRDSGVRILAVVHDAVLIEALTPQLPHAVALAQNAIRQASRQVLYGRLELRSEAHLFYPPDRFEQERGSDRYQLLLRQLESIEGRANSRYLNQIAV